MGQSQLLCLAAVLAAAAASPQPAAAPSIGWLSDPVLPGEHISLSGHGFTPRCKAYIILKQTV